MKTTIRATKTKGRVEVKHSNQQGITGQQQNKPVFIGWDQLDLPTLRFMVAVHRLKNLNLFGIGKNTL